MSWQNSQRRLKVCRKRTLYYRRKAEKFSEAAGEAQSLKEKLVLVKSQLKECTAEFD